ncbi:MAG TPA: type II secretion system F family protein [Burkholderiaceae bacterium]|nr:type II secretion system F family protein [Burkholderiaceae bacterium]
MAILSWLQSPWVVMLAAFAAMALLGWLGIGLLSHSSQRYRERFQTAVGGQLARAHLFIDPGRLLTANLLAIVGTAALVMLITRSLVAAALAAVLLGLVPRIALGWMRHRRRERFRIQLPDLMLLTAGGLRAGASLWQSLAQTSAELPQPARQEIDLMLREQRLGLSLERALAGLEARMNVEEMRMLAAAFRISHETGGNLAETLESLAEATRRKLTLEAKIRALTSQGRLQGWVMGLLPPVLGLVLFQIDPQAMSGLFTTPVGLGVCVAVVVLQVLGFHFVRRIVSVDV